MARRLDPEPSETDRAIRAALAAAYAIMPAAGAVKPEELTAIRGRLDEVGRAARAGKSEHDLESTLAVLYGRCAAIAIASGDPETARGWLYEAERHSTNEAQRAELAAGRDQPERFRALTHGRALFARANEHAAKTYRTPFVRRDERAAWKIWKQLANGSDEIAKAARAEFRVPRPLNGKMPWLATFNGFGTTFAGCRDRWPDGTYATTQCFTLLFIPVFPIASYRVAADGEGWRVLAREPISTFARRMRYVMPAAIAVVIAGVIAGVALYDHVNDRARIMRERFDRALEAAAERPPEAAIRELEAALAEPDRLEAGPSRIQRAGAEIIRITAGTAPKPFRREHVDHANRLVQRYQSLPVPAQGAPARAVLADAIAGWVKELGASGDTAETRLALLRIGAYYADARRSGPLLMQISATRLAVADAMAYDRPLEALALLLEEQSTDAMARASQIVARLVEFPSILIDSGTGSSDGTTLDRWLEVTSPSNPLHQAAKAKRHEALAGRIEAEAAGVTPGQLAAMARKRPWDQYVQLRLAHLEVDAGKRDAAAERLGKLGPRGPLVREVRELLAQLSSAAGRRD